MRTKSIEKESNETDGETTIVDNHVVEGLNGKEYIGLQKGNNKESNRVCNTDVRKINDVDAKASKFSTRTKRDISNVLNNKMTKDQPKGKARRISKRVKKESIPSKRLHKIETDNTDSFYMGAIIGSFLGAAASSVITKLLTGGS